MHNSADGEQSGPHKKRHEAKGGGASARGKYSLGSFIQLAGGRKWKPGRYGSCSRSTLLRSAQQPSLPFFLATVVALKLTASGAVALSSPETAMPTQALDSAHAAVAAAMVMVAGGMASAPVRHTGSACQVQPPKAPPPHAGCAAPPDSRPLVILSAGLTGVHEWSATA